jgi:hypothetical protein
MDESSVRLWPAARPGAVAPPEVGGWADRSLEQPLSLRAQRTAVSLVAFICDDGAVQRRLPQFLLVTERAFPAKLEAMRTLRRPLGPVRVLRGKSAWLTASRLAKLIGEVGRALRPHCADRYIMLSMDACPVHLHPAVLRSIGNAGMHFVPIAARMTRWLQPLDVLAFRILKNRHRQLVERRQLLRGETELAAGEALSILGEAVREVILRRDWAVAFRLCGLAAGEPSSKRFRAALGHPSPMVLDSALPSLEVIAELLPRRRSVSVTDLFWGIMRPPVRRARAARPPAPAATRGGAACSPAPRGPLPRGIPRQLSDAPSFGSHGSGSTAPAHAAPAPLHPATARNRIPFATPLWPWRPLPRPARRPPV